MIMGKNISKKGGPKLNICQKYAVLLLLKLYEKLIN